MSGLVRCDSCNGRKRVLGMGGMEKPCPQCKAIGWMKDETVRDVSVEGLTNQNGNPVIAKRKPGRKPRIQASLEV